MPPDIAKCSLGHKTTPVENHCPTETQYLIEEIKMTTKVIKSWWWVFVVFGYHVHSIRNNSQISLRRGGHFSFGCCLFGVMINVF